jgi:hypothetical protein
MKVAVAMALSSSKAVALIPVAASVAVGLIDPNPAGSIDLAGNPFDDLGRGMSAAGKRVLAAASDDAGKGVAQISTAGSTALSELSKKVDTLIDAGKNSAQAVWGAAWQALSVVRNWTRVTKVLEALSERVVRDNLLEGAAGTMVRQVRILVQKTADFHPDQLEPFIARKPDLLKLEMGKLAEIVEWTSLKQMAGAIQGKAFAAHKRAQTLEIWELLESAKQQGWTLWVKVEQGGVEVYMELVKPTFELAEYSVIKR